ncbi:interleukin-2 receptor subunit beta isoform X2 [Pyxicephalus adspersus]
MSVPSHAWVHLLFILLPQTLIMATDPDCMYNTRGTLFCSWEAESQYSTTPCNVSAKAYGPRDISGSCTLSPNVNPRHCAVQLLYKGGINENPLTVGHKLNVSVICSSAQTKNVVANTPSFVPYDHVRLDPPKSFKIRITEDNKWNLTWVVISNHILNIKTEVLYKPLEATWQNANNITLHEKELSVLLRGLKPNTLYEAKVRVKPKNDIIDQPGVMWSYWSQTIQWKTPEEHVAIVTPLITTMVVVALFLVMLIIFNQKRVKKIIWIGVPNPSSFFDPLMSDYKGNFQKWLSSPFPFSSFIPDPCPLDISPLDVNWNKEDHPKSLFDHALETQTAKSIHFGTSVSNKGYFNPNCLSYDHVDHQGLQSVTCHECLPSPTEDMPLFHADYLCAPLSIAGLGFNNKSFELDSPQRTMQFPLLVEEDIKNEECSSTLAVTTEVIEGEENEQVSPGACSTSALVFHEVKPISNVSDNSSGYLSMNELHQKHAVHWM